MAQYPNARVPFGDILDAIRSKLVTDLVVADANAVVWGTPKNHPQLVGDLDVMLVARGQKHEGRDAGPGQFQVSRYVDIWVRSNAMTDPGMDLESWIRSMFVLGDKILDSVGDDGYWPEDADGNLLTVETIKAVEDSPPDYQVSGNIFGECIVTLSVLYMPAINPSKGVFT